MLTRMTTPAKVRFGRAIGAAIILIAVFFTFLPVTRNDFVRCDDDSCLYYNRLFLDVSWQSFKRAWNPDGVFVTYQPVAYTLMAPVVALAKLKIQDRSICESGAMLDPHPFHWLSLLLHVLDCLLVFALLLLLFPRRVLPCALGSLLFGLHPLQVESVAWASSVDRPINALFSLACLIVYIVAAREKHLVLRRTLYVITVVLSIAAYLAKPVAITLPLAALIIDRCLLHRDWKRVLVWYAPWQSLLMPLIALTRVVTSVDSSSAPPMWTRFFVAGDALTWHLYKLVLPIRLGIDYGRNPSYVLSHWWGYATWLVPFLLAFGLYRYRRNRWVVAAAGLWFCALLPDIGLLPFSYQHRSTVADRYDYLALMGPALALAAWFPCRPRPPKVIAAASLLLLCAVLSATQTRTWKDTPSLVAQASCANPSSDLRLFIAGYYFDHHQFPRAMQLYLDEVNAHPHDMAVRSNVARTLIREGNVAQGAKLLEAHSEDR